MLVSHVEKTRNRHGGKTGQLKCWVINFNIFIHYIIIIYKDDKRKNYIVKLHIMYNLLIVILITGSFRLSLLFLFLKQCCPFIDKGLNYELQFDSSELVYVVSPGPVNRIDQLSVCLWLKTSVTSTFAYYHVEGETGPAFQFGITSSKYLFGKINGSLARRFDIIVVIINIYLVDGIVNRSKTLHLKLNQKNILAIL